jgi:hypothetical protein
MSAPGAFEQTDAGSRIPPRTDSILVRLSNAWRGYPSVNPAK